MRPTRRKKKRSSLKMNRKKKRKLKKNQNVGSAGRELKDAVRIVHGTVWFLKIAFSLIGPWLLSIQ